MTDWRAFAEELLRELDDAQREIADLDLLWLDVDDKTAAVVTPTDPGAVGFVEPSDVEEIVDDFAERWRRRLAVEQLVDDRDRVTS